MDKNSELLRFVSGEMPCAPGAHFLSRSLEAGLTWSEVWDRAPTEWKLWIVVDVLVCLFYDKVDLAIREAAVETCYKSEIAFHRSPCGAVIFNEGPRLDTPWPMNLALQPDQGTLPGTEEEREEFHRLVAEALPTFEEVLPYLEQAIADNQEAE